MHNAHTKNNSNSFIGQNFGDSNSVIGKTIENVFKLLHNWE